MSSISDTSSSSLLAWYFSLSVALISESALAYDFLAQAIRSIDLCRVERLAMDTASIFRLSTEDANFVGTDLRGGPHTRIGLF